jgi:translation initiation factor 2-alpha kinase 4
VNSLLPASKSSVNNLLEMIQLDTTLEQLQTSAIRPLIKGRGEASSLAKGAIREMETVINLAQLMGVNIPMSICLGLSMGHDCSKPGGIVWQLRGELKADKHNRPSLFACGGRFDNLIDDYQKGAHSKGLTIVNREMYSAGFSFAMDKLVFALTQSDDHNNQAIVDILVFVSGARPPLKEVVSVFIFVQISSFSFNFLVFR